MKLNKKYMNENITIVVVGIGIISVFVSIIYWGGIALKDTKQDTMKCTHSQEYQQLSEKLDNFITSSEAFYGDASLSLQNVLDCNK